MDQAKQAHDINSLINAQQQGLIDQMQLLSTVYEAIPDNPDIDQHYLQSRFDAFSLLAASNVISKLIMYSRLSGEFDEMHRLKDLLLDLNAILKTLSPDS